MIKRFLAEQAQSFNLSLSQRALRMGGMALDAGAGCRSWLLVQGCRCNSVFCHVACGKNAFANPACSMLSLHRVMLLDILNHCM
jgi:hypothetical protein